MMTATATAISTFSVTGGLAAEYIARGEMIPWQGTLVVEGGDTGDKRSIKVGALTTRRLPLPFMVQLENPVGGDGHDGATLSGRIDTLERQDGGRWWATGYIDPTSGGDGDIPDGAKLALALDKQMIRGISVDLDQVSITEVQTADGTRQVIEAGRIIGGTATPFAAFAECEIALDVDKMTHPMIAALAASADFADWEDEFEGAMAAVWSPTDAIETLVAFAGSSIPIDPPAEWFDKPTFTELTPLTVTGNGRVFGHIAAWGTCHISFANKCVPVPHSRTNYAKFRQGGGVLTAEGTTVRTGPIVMDTVHPDLRWKASDAMSFYANTGAAVADVIPYEDKFGICVVGAMRPDVTPARIRAFRASDISPDWRNIDGNPRECCALLAVNNSGFKLPIALAASAGMYVEPGDTAIALDPFDDVYALVASGPMSVEPCCDECAAHLTASAEGAPMEDQQTAVKVYDLEEDQKRRAAVRSRFGPKPARVFTLASAEFNHDGAVKAWQSRDHGKGGKGDQKWRDQAGGDGWDPPLSKGKGGKTRTFKTPKSKKASGDKKDKSAIAAIPSGAAPGFLNPKIKVTEADMQEARDENKWRQQAGGDGWDPPLKPYTKVQKEALKRVGVESMHPQKKRTFRVADPKAVAADAAELTHDGAIKAWLIRHGGGDPGQVRVGTVRSGVRTFKAPKAPKVRKEKYRPGMHDSVSMFQPKPGYRHRRLAYRTFVEPGSEATPPD